MSGSRNRLMVMAGGTGGHVYPALAVANALRESGTQVTWLGTRAGLEATIIPAHGIHMHWIGIEGLRGKGVFSWLKAPFKLLVAIWQSCNALREVKPDCVLGMGGFVAGPGGLAARLMRTPLIIHEQNAVAGLTNRVLAAISQKVLSGFPNVSGLPTGAEWVGNPVRQQIERGRGSSDLNNALRILVIGGSQGAHALNTYLPKIFANFSFPVEVWHQTGRGRSDDVGAAYAYLNVDSQAQFSAKVSDFIEDMASAYAWADVLVCRAGAMTIAECCAAGKPALLVPYPYSAGDHQRINAQMMVDAGAAWIMSNQSLSEASAGQTIDSLLTDRLRLKAMGESAAKLHKPDALARIAGVCKEYLHA